MPVVIGKRLISTEQRGNRGRHFDKAVIALAPEINALREQGIRTVRHLADALNAAGKFTEDGKPFNRETVRLISSTDGEAAPRCRSAIGRGCCKPPPLPDAPDNKREP